MSEKREVRTWAPPQHGMTVAELIEKLRYVPQDAEVVLWGTFDGYGGTITEVSVEPGGAVALSGESLWDGR